MTKKSPFFNCMVNTWLFYSCWIYTIYEVLGQKLEQKQIFQTHNDAAKANYTSSDQEQLFFPASVCYICFQLLRTSRVKGISNRINAT